MRISFTATDQPATEPVTPAELRAQVRVDDGGDDAMLMGYLLAARQAAETFLGRPILPTPMLARLEEWPGSSGISGARLVLDAPVITVDAVTYTALDGTTTAWTASASGYVLRDAAGGTKALRPASGVSWPALGSDPVISITITAGWAAAMVPEDIKLAILQMAAHWFSVREVVNIGASVFEIPQTGKDLLKPYRWRLIG
jgi:uncharacterized phiE125 gp8 family phage protein